jgi:PAS domain S-box-containing protein
MSPTLIQDELLPASPDPAPAPGHRVMVVEDEVIISADIQRRLRRMGYTTPFTATSGEEAVRVVADQRPDVVLMDIRLAGTMDGIEAARRIRRQADVPVVFLTAHSDVNTVRRARDTESFGYLTKPFQDRELYACIEFAVFRHQAESAIRRREQWLAAVLKGIGDAVVATDAAGSVLFLNPVAEKLLGWRESEIIGRNFGEVFRIVGELSRRPVSNPVMKALSEGRVTTLVGGVILISRDGMETPIADSAAPIWNHDGQIVGAVMVFRDNTESRRVATQIRQLNEHLEERVRERTAELEAANKELAAFSYTVSHDLRAPLRHLDGYTEMLRQEVAPFLTDQGGHCLSVISSAAKRMGRLIDDLLAFCRAGRMELNRVRLDMNDLVAAVRQDLAPELKDRVIDWDVGPLPEVLGDREMLKQVWVNLLANAIKFTRKRIRARITIGCTFKDGQNEFFVADNGAGFDMAYSHKLFGVFERLHREDEFEGTGIGLANIRRIITRHGGKTRAEGQVGLGATLYFSLPILAAKPAEITAS